MRVTSPKGRKGERTWEIIQKTGIRLLYEHGYEGMNLRMLARESGLTVGSLYNYMTAKDDFVTTLLTETMSELMDDLLNAQKTATDDDSQIRNYVQVMVLWHTRRKEQSLLLLYESRMLSSKHMQKFARLRRAFNTHIFEIVEHGVKNNVFHVADSHIAANAISSMLVSIPLWYKGNGRLGLKAITNEYTALILTMLGVNKN